MSASLAKEETGTEKLSNLQGPTAPTCGGKITPEFSASCPSVPCGCRPGSWDGIQAESSAWEGYKLGVHLAVLGLSEQGQSAQGTGARGVTAHGSWRPDENFGLSRVKGEAIAAHGHDLTWVLKSGAHTEGWGQRQRQVKDSGWTSVAEQRW